MTTADDLIKQAHDNVSDAAGSHAFALELVRLARNDILVEAVKIISLVYIPKPDAGYRAMSESVLMSATEARVKTEAMSKVKELIRVR